MSHTIQFTRIWPIKIYHLAVTVQQFTYITLPAVVWLEKVDWWAKPSKKRLR